MTVTIINDGYYTAYVVEVVESVYVVSAPTDYDAIMGGWSVVPFSSSSYNPIKSVTITMVKGYNQIEVYCASLLGTDVVNINIPQIPTMNDPAYISIPYPQPDANRQYLSYVRTVTYSEFHLSVTKDSLQDVLPLLNPLNTSLPNYVVASSLRVTPQARVMKMYELTNGTPTREVVVI